MGTKRKERNAFWEISEDSLREMGWVLKNEEGPPGLVGNGDNGGRDVAAQTPAGILL